MKILFQGDSITDAGRDYEDDKSLGNGYVNLVSQMIAEKYPEQEFEFINKGISGHRVVDLKNRWQEDCIDLNPDILSIMIGINDVWRAFDSNDKTSVEDFEESYREILTDVKNNTEAKILILEPFLLINSIDKDDWLEDISGKIAATRRLAREFADAYVPLDGIFAGASIYETPSYWAEDGVHPSEQGNALIARNYVHAARRLIAQLS